MKHWNQRKDPGKSRGGVREDRPEKVSDHLFEYGNNEREFQNCEARKTLLANALLRGVKISHLT